MYYKHISQLSVRCGIVLNKVHRYENYKIKIFDRQYVTLQLLIFIQNNVLACSVNTETKEGM